LFLFVVVDRVSRYGPGKPGTRYPLASAKSAGITGVHHHTLQWAVSSHKASFIWCEHFIVNNSPSSVYSIWVWKPVKHLLLLSLILGTTLWGWYCKYHHFTVEETELQGGLVTFLKTQISGKVHIHIWHLKVSP
jgi:hypothetical protein